MITNLNFNGNKIKIYLERPTDISSFYQVFVEKSYPFLMSKINKGDIVIDAGANIGMFSIMASILVGKTGKVIAIEPDPENLKILKRNLELNNISNIIIVDKALYSKSGERLNFYQDGVMSRILLSDNSEPGNHIEVETITLDDIISNINLHPKVLKMDIEGAEKFALLSAQNTFQTINYFEGEIHSPEDYHVLLRYSNLFIFKYEPTELMKNALSFSLKHPVKILRLELHNQFLSTKRFLSWLIKKEQKGKFPINIYGERLLTEK